MRALLQGLDDSAVTQPPFAPPDLRDGDFVVGQTAAILLCLGPALKLVARGEKARIWTHQIQLAVADLVAEVHDTHHPIASPLTDEDQKPEARRRAQDFCSALRPKFLGWFERVLARNPVGSRCPVGDRLSDADLSLFQVVQGLRHAFPHAAARALAATPAVCTLSDRVAALPRVASDLGGERRIAFNETGIFRHDPELDLA